MESTLRDELIQLLGWDAVVAEGVVSAISTAASRAEIDAIANDYIGKSNAAARRSVQAYTNSKFPPTNTTQQEQQQQQQQQLRQQRSDADLKASISMGPNVKTTVKRRPPPVQDDTNASILPYIETVLQYKRVFNCLRCGKVYDCRTETTSTRDVVTFIATDGKCTFCGNQVVVDPNNPNNPTTVTQNDKEEEEAVTLKNTLVKFDREAAKRTTVIDDQSDFFAIDSNAWLTDEERAELKQREREMEEASETQRQRYSVTVDLLGRRVVVVNDRSNDGNVGGEDNKAGGSEVEVAMRATLAERPQGGGAAAIGPNKANNRITACSTMPHKYTFVPKESDRKKKNKQTTTAAAPSPSSQLRSNDTTRPPRLQDDGMFLLSFMYT